MLWNQFLGSDNQNVRIMISVEHFKTETEWMSVCRISILHHWCGKIHFEKFVCKCRSCYCSNSMISLMNYMAFLYHLLLSLSITVKLTQWCGYFGVLQYISIMWTCSWNKEQSKPNLNLANGGGGKAANMITWKAVWWQVWWKEQVDADTQESADGTILKHRQKWK